MLTILTAEKRFSDRWIGSSLLNRAGPHRRRMALAERCAAMRRRAGPRIDEDLACTVAKLDRDGYVVLPDFLAPEQVERLAREVEPVAAQSETRQPSGKRNQTGFGAKIPFEGGFDRYDGATLNRFLEIDQVAMPHAASFARDPRLAKLTRRIVGLPHRPEKTQIYLTRHGDEGQGHDIQKDLHHDTFFSAMKFWYFIRPVCPDDGPFAYVPGSHRLTERRLQWEQRTADDIIDKHNHPNHGGSFRIGADKLASLGLPQPVSLACPANTLVIANVLGFHRRSNALPMSSRLALYGWLRPFPFGLLAH